MIYNLKIKKIDRSLHIILANIGCKRAEGAFKAHKSRLYRRREKNIEKEIPLHFAHVMG